MKVLQNLETTISAPGNQMNSTILTLLTRIMAKIKPATGATQGSPENLSAEDRGV